MDFTSPATATLGVWTIARFAALAVVATEALFLRFRRGDAQASQTQAGSRLFWALTPALLLAGLCFWCTVSVSTSREAPAPVLAQLAR